jgi:type IV pilus assembly protein PilC
MATYVWKGKNRYGDMVGGERVASSIEEVARILQKEQIQVMNVAPKRAAFAIPFLKREKVKLKELSVYSRQLSVLIDAELPLMQSLNILSEQTKNKYFKRVINTVREDVEAGSTLNQAMRKFPKAFDDLYCNLVASGSRAVRWTSCCAAWLSTSRRSSGCAPRSGQAMIYPSLLSSLRSS